MASVDVPVALLGYGTVGAAVNRLLSESADDIERATGHRLRVVRALVRDTAKERDFPAAPGVLTDDYASIRDDPTNFILSRMEAGYSYAQALAEAQALGYAEADPTEDVAGIDAAAKMAILATVAFGSRVELADVTCRGIEQVSGETIAAARELG